MQLLELNSADRGNKQSWCTYQLSHMDEYDAENYKRMKEMLLVLEMKLGLHDSLIDSDVAFVQRASRDGILDTGKDWFGEQFPGGN